jgi:hypothetical protein
MNQNIQRENFFCDSKYSSGSFATALDICIPASCKFKRAAYYIRLLQGRTFFKFNFQIQESRFTKQIVEVLLPRSSFMNARRKCSKTKLCFWYNILSRYHLIVRKTRKQGKRQG